MSNLDNLSKDREELQKAVNTLIQNFEHKYYLQGVRLEIKECTSQDEKNVAGGRIRFLTLTGMRV